MGKDIDWDYIKECGIDLNSPEAAFRRDACLKQVLGAPMTDDEKAVVREVAANFAWENTPPKRS